MQRCVNVIGVGLSPLRAAPLGPDPSLLIGSTIQQALTDAGLSANAITAVHAVSDMTAAAHVQRALHQAGLAQATLCHFPECGSEASALLAHACQAITLGQADCILLLGVQGAPCLPAPEAAYQRLGATAREYLARYQTRPETFAMIAVKARQHAAANPWVAFNEALTLEQVLHAPMIADPLTQPQFAGPSSGVAAVVLCASEFASRLPTRARVAVVAQACIPAQQAGSAVQGTSFAGVNYEANVVAARELYEQAGRGPQEVSVCELHDASTVSELLLYEALGFCLEGNGEKLVEDGDNTYGGNLVINPSGGLLALGQAGATSALAQCIELFHQLRGSAGPRQVADVQLALLHQSGADGTVTTTLFEAG